MIDEDMRVVKKTGMFDEDRRMVKKKPEYEKQAINETARCTRQTQQSTTTANQIHAEKAMQIAYCDRVSLQPAALSEPEACAATQQAQLLFSLKEVESNGTLKNTFGFECPSKVLATAEHQTKTAACALNMAKKADTCTGRSVPEDD